MIRNFDEILKKAQDKGPKRIALPIPLSRRISLVLNKAKTKNLIVPVPVKTFDDAIAVAKNGEADLLFQGDAGMCDFINALTAKGSGIADRETLSYISLFELPSENRLIMLTDTLIQSFPSIKQKVRILENAIEFAGVLGIEKPNIAALSTVELVNFSVPSSLDAAILAKMSERKQLKGIVEGPLDIDCAGSQERARRKGLESPIAGQVTIYFFPDIESSYSVTEVLVFLGRSSPAGSLLGTRLPVILNPRFESSHSLFVDIALACLRV